MSATKGLFRKKLVKYLLTKLTRQRGGGGQCMLLHYNKYKILQSSRSSQEEEHRSGVGGERQEGAGRSLATPHQRTQGPKEGAVPGGVRGLSPLI